MKKFLFVCLFAACLLMPVFAESHYFRIDWPVNGDDLYVYNYSTLDGYVTTFDGAVSSDCVSIRVLWAPADEWAIDKYLYCGTPAAPKNNTAGYSGRIDDYVLKQYKPGDNAFVYNVGGSLDNLEWGTNYYRFIATFRDGSVEMCNLKIYVRQGGYAEKAKPVIYLYPEEKTEVKVTVSPEGGVTESIPEYGRGWDVFATPDGRITDKLTGKEYPYLFWESRDNGSQIDMSEGFVVKTAELQSFFEEKLAYIGLTASEIADFTEYWVPELQGKPYVFITFYSPERIDSEAPLSITPAPDTVIRVYFDHKLLDAPITTAEQNLTSCKRDGFTVVEWGGKRYSAE